MSVAVQELSDVELQAAVEAAALIKLAPKAKAELAARDKLRDAEAHEAAEALDTDVLTLTAVGDVLEAAYVNAIAAAQDYVAAVAEIKTIRAEHDSLHSSVMSRDPSRVPAYVPKLEQRMMADRSLVTDTIEPLRAAALAGTW